ncbi:MAG: reductive dehalogenase [Chloroflexi bacterium]|nr:reductive dehalogenase [Chloroflexota bacterium]
MNTVVRMKNGEPVDATRPTIRSAADIYQVRPDYQRYNQRLNVTRQRLWNPEIEGMFEEREATLHRFLADGRPGYSALDYAFSLASRSNLHTTGFGQNAPNTKGNSWQPITKQSPARRWEGIPAEASKVVGKMARLFGASVVGFAPLDRRWVYSRYYDEKTKLDHPIRFTDEPGYEQYTRPGFAEDKSLVIPKEVRYAVVMLFEMDEEGMNRAPTLIQGATVTMTYSRISFTTVMVAEFLRGLGYHAIPSANCTALSIPLAVDAGLGELGRNAKLIAPWFGPRCRIAKVLTDLPLEVAGPRDFGITEFCNVCRKCAKHCPCQAIPSGERSFEPVNECNNAGVLLWQMDHKKCFSYSRKVGTSCAVCIRVCPFNKGHSRVHGAVRFGIKHAPWMDKVVVRLDDALGYGKLRPPEAFWDVR